MTKKYIMSLDQGTTSSRCIIFNYKGEQIAKSQNDFAQIYPQNGWVEHRPLDIWESQLQAIKDCLEIGKIDLTDIAAIGLTNQRETTIVWDKNTGKPIYNAIVWQCRRSAEYCQRLQKQGYADLIYSKTGLVLDAYFSATKLNWILDNVANARKKAGCGDLLFGTVDTYLLWRLTNGTIHATDTTNASRTMLFNIHTMQWDDELLKIFSIPKCMLPTVHQSSHLYGYTDKKLFGESIPICGVVGDQQGSLFGQLCTYKGSIKNTYGTGCFMLMHTGDKPTISKHGLITTLAASLDEKPQYALEGSVFVGGAVIQWLRDEMHILRTAAISEKYANKVKDTNGVYIVPAFVGLGAPYWNPDARGSITGLTRGTNKSHVIRAALESIAFQVCDVLKAMEQDVNQTVSCLNVDGGASANNFLMQFQADILNVTITRPSVIETTALGACYLAGLNCGFWKDIEDIKANATTYKEYLPQMQEANRLQLLNGWKEAIKKTI